jgi:hypothetical protein
MNSGVGVGLRRMWVCSPAVSPPWSYLAGSKKLLPGRYWPPQGWVRACCGHPQTRKVLFRGPSDPQMAKWDMAK